MRVLVVANGELGNVDTKLLDSNSFDQIIAVDGGFIHCQALGLSPDIIIGDLDSISETDRELLQRSNTGLISFPAAKDEIDLERAKVALGRAEDALKALSQEDKDFVVMEAALERALIRIQVAGHKMR